MALGSLQLYLTTLKLSNIIEDLVANEPTASDGFARAFGDALRAFLDENGIGPSDAAKRLGLGKKGVSRLGTYCHDSTKGKRATPSAEMLYLICSTLDFEFAYKGCKISTPTLGMNGSRGLRPQPQQLSLPFNRQFYLSDDKGTVSVSVRRPAGRVEVSISLKAAS